jgi:hypothetical protein
LKWSSYKTRWLTMLSELDAWYKGERENPIPEANHYGGRMDSPQKHWRRVYPAGGLRFRNRFYSSLPRRVSH